MSEVVSQTRHTKVQRRVSSSRLSTAGTVRRWQIVMGVLGGSLLHLCMPALDVKPALLPKISNNLPPKSFSRRHLYLVWYMVSKYRPTRPYPYQASTLGGAAAGACRGRPCRAARPHGVFRGTGFGRRNPPSLRLVGGPSNYYCCEEICCRGRAKFLRAYLSDRPTHSRPFPSSSASLPLLK